MQAHHGRLGREEWDKYICIFASLTPLPGRVIWYSINMGVRLFKKYETAAREYETCRSHSFWSQWSMIQQVECPNIRYCFNLRFFKETCIKKCPQCAAVLKHKCLMVALAKDRHTYIQLSSKIRFWLNQFITFDELRKKISLKSHTFKFNLT